MVDVTVSGSPRLRARLFAVLTGTFTLLAGCVPGPAIPPRPERLVPVIPAPHVTRSGVGTGNAPDTLEVRVADTGNAELKALGRLAVETGTAATGMPVRRTRGRRVRGGAIQFRQIPALVAEKAGTYPLSAAREGIAISSPTGVGLLYGLQTLRPLLESIATPHPPSAIR